VTDKEEYLESENARLRALLKQAGLDAAATDVAQRLQRLLLSEMHHRIKNMLAMVQSIVAQSLRSANSPAEALDAIAHRISALARSHDAILSDTGDSPQLKVLFEDMIVSFESGRFQIDLPAAKISSKGAVSLALVINELATNAVKYGALSVPNGRVVISGHKDDAAHEIIVMWTEHGGPPVREPARSNFGTQLIRTALPSEPILEFRRAGVFCEMRVPLPLDENST
jgi:two-component sensor histidine kinase